MNWMHRLLGLIVAVEVLMGGFLAYRRLAQPVPPQADWSLLDAATADQIRTAAAGCKTARHWRNLAELYMAAGCFQESELCHHAACDLDPGNAVFARQWGFALERLALLDEANAQYRRARGHYYVGRELLKFGHADKSIAYFKTAADLDPRMSQAWFYLGEARRLCRQKEPAAAAYRSCLELDPDHGRALASLAQLEGQNK